jgi:NitT/TauT family transport system substrate-binding protein
MERLIGACAAVAALAVRAPVSAANPPMARVGYQPNIAMATGIVGFCPQKQTYYKAFPGVNFNNSLFTNGQKAIDAMRAGALDMAFVGGGPAIMAYSKSKDLVILANSASGASVLLARRGGKVRRVADLAGRRVGVPAPGTNQDILLRYQLALNGLRPTDRGGKVQVVLVENAALADSFRHGGLDAACVPEPWASRLEREGLATVLLSPTQLFNNGAYPATVLLARRDFVTGNRDFAKRFAKVTDVITRAISQHPDTFIPILGSEMKRLAGQDWPSVVIRSAVLRTRFTSHIDQHEVAVFANLVELAGYRSPGQSLDGILWR